MSNRRTPSPLTLEHLLNALRDAEIAPDRLRDLRSAVRRVAAFLGLQPGEVPLAISDIADGLADLKSAALGITEKSLSNIRSNFIAAVRVSGLATNGRVRAKRTPLWCELIDKLPAKRQVTGLSRLANYASARDLGPSDISDRIVDDFIESVKDATLHRNPVLLKRNTIAIWNEVAIALPNENLRQLARVETKVPRRVAWEALAPEFRRDVDEYLAWLKCDDPFAEGARIKPLAPRTIKLRHNQIHTAVTALIGSGIDPAAIQSLSDLVGEDNFKRIFKHRGVSAHSENGFNRDLAEMLVRMAKEWVKLDEGSLERLRNLLRHVKAPVPGLTTKNKALLRQFDDPAVWQRLLDLPANLWRQSRNAKTLNCRVLARAQAAIAIRCLTFMPIRLQNLADLEFDRHVFLKPLGAVSTLELMPEEVKNGVPLSFDIPPAFADMLRSYRDELAPPIIGRRPDRLFFNFDAQPKGSACVANLIKTQLRKGVGIEMTPHQFRHLAAKKMLDHEPGSYELVRQLLGHQNLKKTVVYYAGMDSRRAGIHHHTLIEKTLQAQLKHRRTK
jgi:integrase